MLVKIDVAAVHIHIHNDAPSPLLAQILEETQTMNEAVQRLQADVTGLTSVVASACTLIAGMAQQIRDNAEDPAALNALADQLEASQTQLAEAVTENTQAADEPAPPADTTGGDTGGGTDGGAAPIDTGASSGTDSPTVSSDAGSTTGNESADTTSASAPAGGAEPADSGQSAIDHTVDAPAGEQATANQLGNEGAGDDGAPVVTP